MSIRILLRAVMVLVVTAAAVAAEPLPEGLRRCAAIADISVRVACYDQLSATAPAPTAASVPAAASAGAGVAAADTKAVTVTPKAATPKAAAYGEADLKKSSADREADATPKSLDARVTALHPMAPGVFLISLDNGQIWQQEEARPAFTINVGDTARIKSGSMGSHSMSRLSNGKTSGWVRVTRKQ